ncbi:hypothetical protein SteCoe_4674 [Stentor coeruleus]|uniref:Uncharacterized protein n=1 Tax=Stentor coeruleus TaxID=5963 RepID=A0A1R2CU75_9CILI|nr:hypothetical protein SteCoe_4674 [Stentor coeruleus]
MSYLSPNSILLKDIGTPFKVSKKPRRFKKSLKSQILNSSFIGIKDIQARKPTLPDIIVPERKPIHGRSALMKTHTLPLIKANESEGDSKSQISQPEGQSIEKIHLPLPNSVISMQKHIRTSVKKIRLHTFLQPEQKKSPADEIRIEITNCDDIPDSNNKNSNKTPDQFLYPPILSPCSSKSSKRSSGKTLSPAVSRSSSFSDRKTKNDDPFFYINILKNLNFSSFNYILDAIIDPFNSTFPYYNRIMKVITKIKPTEKKPLNRQPKGYHECTCNKGQILDLKKPINTNDIKMARIPFIDEISHCIPGLKCMKLDMQTVKYEDYVIILNFEGVLGCYISEICIKPGTLRNIKKLEVFFRIVLVLQTNEDKANRILSIFKGLGISLSGIYQRQDRYKNFELRKLQDYSKIYEDFNIKDPEKQVFIIASHKFLENIEENPYGVVSSKVGLSHKLCVDRAPFTCKGYERPPVTVLLPNYQIKNNNRILKKLIRQVNIVEKIDHGKEHLSFRSLFSNPQYLTVYSSVIHEIFLDFFEVNRKRAMKAGMGEGKIESKHISYCKLHRKYMGRYNDTLYENIFIIN